MTGTAFWHIVTRKPRLSQKLRKAGLYYIRIRAGLSGGVDPGAGEKFRNKGNPGARDRHYRVSRTGENPHAGGNPHAGENHRFGDWERDGVTTRSCFLYPPRRKK